MPQIYKDIITNNGGHLDGKKHLNSLHLLDYWCTYINTTQWYLFINGISSA